MNKYLFAIAVALVLAVGAGCRKNVDDTTIKGPIDVELVETSVAGYVISENGEALPFATVTIGNTTVQTNKRGIFLIQDQLFDKNGTLVKVAYAGYHDAFRFVYPHLGTVNQVEIRMRAKNSPVTFNAASGHTLQLASGDVEVQVTIPANAVGDPNGQPWTGTVAARAVAYDPTNDKDRRVVPGDFRAQDRDGNARILQSFGMFGVELTTTAGAPLNLLPGQKAKISLKIPGSLSGQAPDEIPLWHFNENNGYWEEEGRATLVNGRYEGEVSHFSFWNCDVPNDFAFVKGRVITTNGQPASYSQLSITSVNWGSVTGYCDNNGYFSGFIPANELLKLQIGRGCTDNVVEIGPFEPSSQNDIGDQNASPSLLTYRGKLLSCDGSPLANGLVYVRGDSLGTFSIQHLAISDANGDFSLISNSCELPTLARIQAYDLVNNFESAVSAQYFTNYTFNFGNILVCNPLEEYIILELDGTTPTTYNYKIDASLNYSFSDSLFFSGNYLDNNNELQEIRCNVTYTGNGAASGVLYHYYATLTNGNETFFVNCIDCRNDVVTLAELPTNVGDFASGTFSGTALQTNNSSGVLTEIPYTIKFRVKRDQ
jgi:hypothetical protein